MTPDYEQEFALLTEAARASGLDATGAELIRDGSNVMYSLPGHIVARIGRAGRARTAQREVATAQWLDQAGVAVVEPVANVPQAVVVDDRPVTWWTQLPPHRAATPAELGSVLRAIHALPPPHNLELPSFDPFSGIEQRIDQAPKLEPDDRQWLVKHLAALRQQCAESSTDEPARVIHGDAWQGNIAVPDSGLPIVLDLEAVAIGRPEWDLVQLAVDYTDFARVSAEDYHAFTESYGGYDATLAPDYRALADVQELRWVSFALSKADTSSEAAAEAAHRVACIRGDVPKPWSWAAF